MIAIFMRASDRRRDEEDILILKHFPGKGVARVKRSEARRSIHQAGASRVTQRAPPGLRFSAVPVARVERSATRDSASAGIQHQSARSPKLSSSADPLPPQSAG